MAAADATQTIFVRNINYDTDGQALGTAFEKFGAVKNARIVTVFDPDSEERVSRGFGFVDFQTADGFSAALAAHDPIIVDERELFVRAARPARKRDTAFLLGIPKGTTNDDVKAAFAKYNPVDVRIKAESDGHRKGFGFVIFDTEENQTAAVTENRSVTIRGADVSVRVARRRGFGFRGGPGGGRGRPWAGRWGRDPPRAAREASRPAQSAAPRAPRGGLRPRGPAGEESPFVWRADQA
jgi:RNA recognition motif-containing protein